MTRIAVFAAGLQAAFAMGAYFLLSGKPENVALIRGTSST